MYEDAETCARGELEEETGLQARILKIYRNLTGTLEYKIEKRRYVRSNNRRYGRLCV